VSEGPQPTQWSRVLSHRKGLGWGGVVLYVEPVTSATGASTMSGSAVCVCACVCARVCVVRALVCVFVG
jgi:hypothetical protein